MKHKIRLALAATLALASGTALAAGEQYYLYVEGIPGTSLDHGLADYNELASWSLGFSRGSCQALTLTKDVNASSPEFTAGALLGTFYPTAVLVARRYTGDGGPFRYMRVTLTNLVISAVSTGGTAFTTAPNESISLQPSTVKIEIFRQTATGAAVLDAQSTVTCQRIK